MLYGSFECIPAYLSFLYISRSRSAPLSRLSRKSRSRSRSRSSEPERLSFSRDVQIFAPPPRRSLSWFVRYDDSESRSLPRRSRLSAMCIQIWYDLNSKSWICQFYSYRNIYPFCKDRDPFHASFVCNCSVRYCLRRRHLRRLLHHCDDRCVRGDHASVMMVNLYPAIVNDSYCHYSMDHRRRLRLRRHHHHLHRRRHRRRQVRCHDRDNWRNDRVHSRALNCCTLSSVE